MVRALPAAPRIALTGTPLFPRTVGDLDMRCSCPDWEVPCKHLAAVCYVLAEEFDRDPSAAPDLLLSMFPPPPVKVRGKDLADVLAPAYHRLADETGG
jgi:hypothetical protein